MNTGGPAFPQHGWSKDPEVSRRMKDQGGMTLLDWMAGQALVGLLASPNILSALIDECETDDTPKPIAIKAYEMASAMLAEKARREATGKDCLTVPNHSPDALKTAKQPDACALLRKFIDAVPEGFETSLLWDLRKDAIHLLDVVPDHFPDATKMVALEAANRELVEALEALTLVVGLTPLAGNKDAMQEAMDSARTILAKHKATK